MSALSYYSKFIVAVLFWWWWGAMASAQGITFYDSTGNKSVTFYNGNNNLYEACRNDELIFEYNGFSPDSILFNSSIQPISTRSLGISNMYFQIRLEREPDSIINLINGSIEFRDTNGNVLFTLPSLTIHNPTVDFVPLASPLCATNDSIPLYVIPKGGTFYSNGAVVPYFFLDTLANEYYIDATQAVWTSNHDAVITNQITYSYWPTYSNGDRCPDSSTSSQTINIYDNRIEDLAFAPIIKDTIDLFLNEVELTLDSLINDSTGIITVLQPDLFHGNIPPYPYSFTGTYVDGNNVFLGNIAAPVNPITFEFNNNGCIGSITTDLDVYEPLAIVNLPDTLCEDAEPILLRRDSNVVYKVETKFYGGRPPDIKKRTIENKVVGLFTDDPNHQRAIEFIDTTAGAEIFRLTPDSLPSGTQKVILRMIYHEIEENYDRSPNVIDTNKTKITPFTVIDTITITPRPTIDLSSVPTSYCANGDLDTLRPMPAFEYSSRTFFRFEEVDSMGTYSLLQDTIIDSKSIYDLLTDTSDRRVNIKLTYTVDRYGCRDSSSTNFIIWPATKVQLFPRSSYCRNEGFGGIVRTPSTIQASESERWLPAPGLDTVDGLFNPSLAGVGAFPITYIFTDEYGCSYGDTAIFVVRPAPVIQTILDGDPNKTTFCLNSADVDIRSTLLFGNIIDSIEYSGSGVFDSTFSPIAAGAGTHIIRVTAIDTAGCDVDNALRVVVIQGPPIDIDRAFNNLSSIYGPNNNRTEHTYCRNVPAFPIDGTPNYIDTITGNLRGDITGLGVQQFNNTFYYNPALVPPGIEVDTVIYTYKDTNRCVSIETAIIKIDTVPIVSLSGFTSFSFCSNEANVPLQGLPDPTVSQGVGIFKGFGVNPNTGVFNPARAGTGPRSIIYEFEDGNNCVDADTVDIFINSPTRAEFGGYRNQYCINDTDTLFSLNDVVTGSYYFYGSVIIDSIGVLRGSASTVGFQDIFYVYRDSNNCVDTVSDNVLINGQPDIEIYGLDSVYCYNDPIDVITVVPAGAGGSLVASDTAFSTMVNTIVFNPSLGTPGIKTFTYGYRDNIGCESSLTLRTYVHAPPLPNVPNFSLLQCETNDTIPIAGSPYWGTFSGPGITFDNSMPIDSIWGFNPARAGIGRHTIIYSVKDTLTGYTLYNGQTADSVCAAERILDVNVRPLPNPSFLSPANNTRFCSNDAPVVLQPDSLSPVWDSFRDTSGGISFTTRTIFVPVGGGLFQPVTDTVYTFDPSVVGAGVHQITYIATDSVSYCQDSINITYIIDGYIPVSFPLDSAYCASNDSVLLNGTPAGGLFTRNGRVLNPLRNTPYFLFDPTDTSVVMDTVVYAVTYGACTDTVTKIVRTNPLPQLSFTTINAPHNTYCLGDDRVFLNTPNTGGSFDGSPGVLAGNQFFYPDLAGAGSHLITLQYQDSSTGCSNTFSDTLHVYGRPNLDFAIVGGCQYDSIYFNPNNAVLGLSNTNQNRVVDSITSVQWIFDSNTIVAGTYRSNQVDSNLIDTIAHVYNAAGVYYPQLIVANRVYCVDTQTVRWVISPSVNSFPYVQDFEADAGEWFAESRDSSHGLLWEWGTDNNSQGIPANVSNHVWMTQTGAAYGGGEDAWVYSPCFDMDSLNRPMISMDYWVDARPQFDGVVVEYQKTDGSWAPLGEVGRGIDWFNTPSIAGSPGDDSHRIFSLGWSGESGSWQNGRYKLDDYRGSDNKLRMRIAFASLSNAPQDFYDGFAFDNVIVRDRTRNVLLETMVHDKYTNMEAINNRTYQLIHHTNLNKDVVLLQYHIENVNPQGGINTPKDKFYLNNPSLSSTRSYEYSGPPAGSSFINGMDSNITYVTEFLTDMDFEQDMLETPKFSITIDTFEHINNNFKIVANVTAQEAMPSANYRIYTVISEDSLSYNVGSGYNSQVHAVVRENDQYHLNTSVGTNNLYNNRAWAMGETQRVEFNWNHVNSGFINYEPGDFQAVVFIQNISTKEIFQVATTRDVSGYWVGIDPIVAKEELNEIQSVNLYPNPAHDYFNLEFEQTLKNDYQWKLVDIRGVHIREGEIRAGNDRLLIDGLDYPAGTYILLLYNNKVFVQRKVVLGRP